VGRVYFFRRVCKIAKSDSWLRHICPSVRPSERMEQLGSHWTDFHIILWLIFENLLRKYKSNLNLTKLTGSLYEDMWTFMIVPLRIILGMRNVSDEISRERQNTHFVFDDVFLQIVPFTG
jgi:hypothetical protein